MAQIQITDLDFCDSELMNELTDEELLKINGGSFWYDLNDAFNRALFGSGGIKIEIRIPLGGGSNGQSRALN